MLLHTAFVLPAPFASATDPFVPDILFAAVSARHTVFVLHTPFASTSVLHTAFAIPSMLHSAFTSPPKQPPQFFTSPPKQPPQFFTSPHLLFIFVIVAANTTAHLTVASLALKKHLNQFKFTQHPHYQIIDCNVSLLLHYYLRINLDLAYYLTCYLFPYLFFYFSDKFNNKTK